MNYLNRIIVLAAVAALGSCDIEDADYIGPAVISAPEDFEVTAFAASSDSANFDSDAVDFAATFSDPVSWTLTIEGAASGAKKSFNGLSDVVDITWQGGHDGTYFFRQGEAVTATLSFLGTDKAETLNLDLGATADLTIGSVFPKSGNFEVDAEIDFPSWARFNVTEQGVDSMARDRNGSLVKPVEGKGYYYIKGIGGDPVFVDGIQYLGPWSDIPADPDSVYFNIFLYGSEDPNATLVIELQEEDEDGIKAGYQGQDDDAFVTEVNLTHKGWKMFTFRYSDLTPSVNADFGGSGNKTMEPDRMKGIVLVLLKIQDPSSEVEVFFDYPIITFGGPFNPSK